MVPVYCENLTWLSLPNQSITDESLYSLSSLKLQRLELRGSKVTDAGVIKILESCPLLEHLNVDNCFLVSIKVLERAFDLVKEKKLNRDLLIVYNTYRVKIDLHTDKSNFPEYDQREEDDYDEDSFDDEEFLRESDFDEEEEMT